jgi:hypothetical protein
MGNVNSFHKNIYFTYYALWRRDIMPFMNRPPSPLFARRMMHPRMEAPVQDTVEKTDTEAAMKIFPLEIKNEEKNVHENNRQRTVTPLSHFQSPHNRPNILGQYPPQATAQPAHQSVPQQNFPPQAPPRSSFPQPQPLLKQMQPQSPQLQPPVKQMPPQENIPPERAAEQFRQMNKKLPDGVRYEPLDEQTLKLLRDNGHLPAQAGAPASQQFAAQAGTPDLKQSASQQLHPKNTTPQNPTSQNYTLQKPIPQEMNNLTPQETKKPDPQPIIPIPIASVKIIEGLLQDGQNAHKFYTHVAMLAPDEDIAKIFNHLIKEGEAQREQYNALLLRFFNHHFQPVDKEINLKLSYNKALAFALVEENKTLNTLANLVAVIHNPEAEKVLQYIINKKIVGYNQLLILHNSY